MRQKRRASRTRANGCTSPWCWLAPSYDPHGDLWLGDDLVGTYGDLVSWELHADRQTCDPYMLEKCADWKEDMIGQGITWLRSLAQV